METGRLGRRRWCIKLIRSCLCPFGGLFSHPGIHLKQLLQPFGVVFEAAAYVDAFDDFVIAVVGGAQVVGHGGRVVEVGDGGGEMGLSGEQDVFSAAGQVGDVFFGEQGDGEGVPAHGVRVAEVGF